MWSVKLYIAPFAIIICYKVIGKLIAEKSKHTTVPEQAQNVKGILT
jgi:hypothetical protein